MQTIVLIWEPKASHSIVTVHPSTVCFVMVHPTEITIPIASQYHTGKSETCVCGFNHGYETHH